MPKGPPGLQLPNTQPNSTTNAFQISSDDGRVCPMLPHLTIHHEWHISIPQGESVRMAQAPLFSWDM